MPKLTVVTDEAASEIPFSQGTSLREILDAAGLRVRSGCRGNGACGLCLVQIEAGNVNNPSENESLILSPEQIKQNTRLACQLMPENDLRIRIRNTVSGGPSSAASGDGWNMNNFLYSYPQLFEAFIKSAQYIVRLKTQQDIWDHMGKFILTYFPADWVAFVLRDSANAISIYHCTLPDAASQRILTGEVRGLIADVLDSGFLASQVILTPARSMTAFLPIVEEYRTERVMLIGHKTADPLPKELLNIYLAIAGLAGITSERLHNERELNRHRAHLEELVKERTAELDSANKELEAFSYSVSHDLRAPLRSITGFSQVLLDDYAERLDDEGKDSLERIIAGGRRMGQIIDDMLNLSRVSRSELKRGQVNLSAVARKIGEELRAADPERHVEFVIADGLMTKGDGQLLHQVLENLLGNAWKFTEKRKKARIEFGLLQRGDEEIYFVRDNGAGFDMAYADKLFSPFQRLHNTSEYQGTGIGLATVKRIVVRHGGRVWIEGEVEKGSVVYFTLP
jgi:signal transduction histidine kinase/ferredoxin